ncbi:hypothetical protein O3M35_008849 [Rhynocoris fuscipes]|uniref:Uncharacterized protein n=1 Tax=Rhynocoris fuscipes TaxID=488301 RepID=A0AAW1D8C2_9HEMI
MLIKNDVHMSIENGRKVNYRNNDEAYYYFNTGYPSGPTKKHAVNVLNKFAEALDNMLPYVGFIALKTWKKYCSRDKLKKIYTVYLYLLYARRELMTLTEYYINNDDYGVVIKKTKSLWWALDSARTQLNNKI